MNARLDENVHLPNGVTVRIRPVVPADAPAVRRLLSAPDTIRSDSAPEDAPTIGIELVADVPWGGHILGHGVCRRAHGPRAHAALAVAPEHRRTGLALQLLARLARVADQAMIPVLVVAPDAQLLAFAGSGFGANRAAEPLELPTREWPRALAAARRLRVAEVTA